jgi:hypothetical protein
LFLTAGLPRWLVGDGASVKPRVVDVAALCRAHGGTPTGSGVCSVRYGHQVYVMDAITPAGFDADTARFQRQGCAQAAGSAIGARAGRAFVYHADSGVCEHRE